jgi:hypothetical protein
MDPAIFALRAALPESTYDVESLDALLAFLRSHGALRDDDLRLPPKTGMKALVRRLKAALARLSAPEPGFAPPAGYRVVRSTSELQSIGKVFRNCVALPQWHAGGHHIRLVDGSGVYLISDAPPLLVALRRVHANVWMLEQMAGPENAPAPAGAHDALLRDLAAAGLRIIATDPAAALSRLDESRRRIPRFAEAEVQDGGGDDEDDGELAA